MQRELSGGFTLIELLVVMGIITTVGVVIVNIFTSALRGTNKINALSVYRENGNFVISQMVKRIRYAKEFDGISNDEGMTFTPDCSTSGNAIRFISDADTTPPSDMQTTFTCDTANKNITATTAILPNPPGPSTNLFASTMPVTSCSFSCQLIGSSQKPLVSIDFTLSNANTATTYENEAAIPFHTSVIFRNDVLPTP